jgi:hypothetical protein
VRRRVFYRAQITEVFFDSLDHWNGFVASSSIDAVLQ